MKRFFAIMILLATILVTACGQSGELLPFLGDESGLDLNNIEVKWVWTGGTITTPKYVIDTPQYDALISRISEIESELGCDIVYNIPTGDVALDRNLEVVNVEAELMAGSLDYDIVFTNLHSESFKTGMYYSMMDLSDYIDWTDSEKFGHRGLLEAGMYHGVPYMVYPINWPGFDGVEMCVAAYNRDLFGQYALTDPQEFYEQKIWTYDTFTNEFLAKIDIDNSANEAKRYAFQTDEPDFYQCLIVSNNVQFVRKAEDGSYVAEPYPQSFVNAITWAQNTIREYKDIILYDSDTYANEEYCMGEVFMAWAPTNTVTTGSIAYNDKAVFDSGVMPLPAGPDAVYGEWGQCVQDLMGFCIPVTSLKYEAAATVIDALCEPLTGFENKRDFYEMTFTNPLDVEIYLELGKHTRYDYTYDDDRVGRTLGEFFGEVATQPGRSIYEATETLRHVMTNLVENWILPNYGTVHAED